MPVQTTVGIASTETFGYDLDILVRRADMAVYAAKQQGRNRIVVATLAAAAADAEPDAAIAAPQAAR
jgi:predicted signal transduction protein with EAL and GGDEF domain